MHMVPTERGGSGFLQCKDTVRHLLCSFRQRFDESVFGTDLFEPFLVMQLVAGNHLRLTTAVAVNCNFPTKCHQTHTFVRVGFPALTGNPEIQTYQQFTQLLLQKRTNLLPCFNLLVHSGLNALQTRYPGRVALGLDRSIDEPVFRGNVEPCGHTTTVI